MRICSYVFCGLVWILASCPAGFAQPRDLILLHPGVDGSLYDLSVSEFASRVNARLPEGQTLRVVADPALGDGQALLDALRENRATLALCSSALLAVSPRFAIFELPYLIRDRQQVRVIGERLLPEYLQPAAQDRGYDILAVWENGFRHLTNDLQPISEVQDLDGVRIAVPDNGWRVRTLEAFGATPVPLRPGTIADAVHDQRVDGQEAPLTDIAAWKLAEIQRHLTLSDHLYSPAFLIASRKTFAELPAETRDVLTSEAAALEDWVERTAIRLESELVDRLDRRMELSHADLAAFEAAGRTVYKDFIQAVPEGMAMIEVMTSAPSVTASNKPDD